MRIFILLILFCVATNSLAQTAKVENNRFLTRQQNENWLTTTKSLDKSSQWIAIKQRFFFKENQNVSKDSIQYSPLLVINGVTLNVPDKLTDKNSKKILTLLDEDAVEQIVILDKLSEDWTFHRPFSGVIILTVDKKTNKKLFKVKLE